MLAVVRHQDTEPLFRHTNEVVVTRWLERNPSDEERYVYNHATAVILTEAEFLNRG